MRKFILILFSFLTLASNAQELKKINTEVNKIKFRNLPASLQGYGFSTLSLSKSSLLNAGLFLEKNPPLNKLHSWKLYLETIDGSDLNVQSIDISGGMPEHGHGLPTQPYVTKSIGEGLFLIEGLKFNMAGLWLIRLNVIWNDKKDDISFLFKIEN